MTADQCALIGDVIHCRCGKPSSHYGTMGERGARVVREVLPSNLVSQLRDIAHAIYMQNAFRAGQLEVIADELERGAHETNGWQPIVTAPRDGTYVLLCLLYSDGSHSQMVGYYGSYGRGGWTTGTSWTQEPTHWRPLPAGPQVKAEAPPCVFRSGCVNGQKCIDAGHCTHGAQMFERMSAAEKTSVPTGETK